MRYLTGFLILLLTSCATTANYYGQVVNSWNGGNAKTLLQYWGKPNQTVITASGGKEYAYMTSSRHRFPYPSTPDFVIVGPNNQTIGMALPPNNPEYYTLHCITTFVVDQKDNIIATSYSGGGCFANEAVGEARSNPHK